VCGCRDGGVNITITGENFGIGLDYTFDMGGLYSYTSSRRLSALYEERGQVSALSGGVSLVVFNTNKSIAVFSSPAGQSNSALTVTLTVAGQVHCSIQTWKSEV
jgi:hypothetical protein